MPATPAPPRRKNARKPHKTRPIPEVLRDIAYYLHSTRAVACRAPAKSR